MSSGFEPLRRRPDGIEIQSLAAPLVHGGRAIWMWSSAWGQPDTSTIYDPRTDEWSLLPSPKVDLETAFAISAGDELLVWGSGGGQRLDAAQRWRPMATAKQPGARRYARKVWTGRELLIWGGASGLTPITNGAAYNPSTDTWRRLPKQGAPSSHNGTFLWSGSELWVWGGQLWKNSASISTNYTKHAYDPVANRWRTIAPLPGSFFDLIECVADLAFYVSAVGTAYEAWRYEPRADLWEPCAPPEVTGHARLVASDQRLALVCGRDVLEYQVGRDTWTPFARLPETDRPNVLWLDGALYAFGPEGGVWRAR